MLAALRWRRPGHWNLVISDRSSLFDVWRRLLEGSDQQVQEYACAPLEDRLKVILDELKETWVPDCGKPSWRMHQEAYPALWNVSRTVSGDESARCRWLCRLAWSRDGLVGGDVKSHQESTVCPFPVVVQGNEAQDAACNLRRRSPRPPDILMPSGGYFANLVIDGRLVTKSPKNAVRALLRAQCAAAWGLRARSQLWVD